MENGVQEELEEGVVEEEVEEEGGLELDMWAGQWRLGECGEGLGEGRWGREEGMTCRRLAMEVREEQEEASRRRVAGLEEATLEEVLEELQGRDTAVTHHYWSLVSCRAAKKCLAEGFNQAL